MRRVERDDRRNWRFYPDKEPTQRVGILSDEEVKPTIAGIRAGRDEGLEAAVSRILGPNAPQAVVEKIASLR